MKIKIVNGFDGLKKRLVSIDKINKNEVILKLNGKILDHPTSRTIQVGRKEHLRNSFIDYLNHSCNSNSHIDTEKLAILADRVIKQFDDITVNYLSTEYQMVNPFKCNCRSKNCFKEIKGYKFLDKGIKVKNLAGHLLKPENKLNVD